MGSPDAAEQAWRDQAACIGADPRIFTEPRPDTDDTRHAIRICASCPVRQPCLDTALAHDREADIGVWGGTTARVRQGMRRNANPPSPTPPMIGLHHTLDGELTDLTGRARIIQLPVTPQLLLLLDHTPTLRTDSLDQIRHHLTTHLDDYQPDRLAPLTIAANGDLTDPNGSVTITRLPTPPHLLITEHGHPHTRTDTLDHARHHALTLLRPATPRHPQPPAATAPSPTGPGGSTRRR